MLEPIDWCCYFQGIEKDPTAITPRLTVRQFVAAREHVYGCDTCYNRMNRVLERHKNEPESPGSVN